MTVNQATLNKTPLEDWIAKRIGAGGDSLTREMISRYQLQKLRETISWAKQRSPFYRKLLNGITDTEPACLGDLARLPFTTAADISEHSLQFLCVSQDEISRVVTLDSSGTTGRPKRLYFTPFEQELTINFFQHGMSTLVGVGERVLILLPGERPGSIGALLATALRRLGAEPVLHGVVRSIPETLAIMVRNQVNSLVGIPVQALALARYAEQAAQQTLRLNSVLLSTDHVPRAIVRELENLWGCRVFEHYGMTEMGLGGGTACAAHAGYHLHEADFYFEIVDPLTGEPLPEGQEGEVVVSTLTRQGMPLLRYRTGDISRLLTGPCACGTVLHRLGRIAGRKDSRILLNGNLYFTLTDLDEAFFSVDKVINFTAAVDNKHLATTLSVTALTVDRPDIVVESAIRQALESVPAIRQARQAGRLTVDVRTAACEGILAPNTAKRVITELERDDAK